MTRETKHSPALRDVLEAARQRAFAAKHPKVTPQHLFAAILDDADARKTIEGAGGSIPELTAFASAGLQNVSPVSVWERLVAALERPRVVESFGFRSALHRAWSRVGRASQVEVGVVDLLAALFHEAEIGAGMRQSGLTRLALLRYYSHGSRGGEGQLEPVISVQAQVVVFNDHYTEMETVVRILQKAFDLRPSEAFKAMMRVHQDGQALIGPFSTDEAIRRIELATRMAEAEEAPLRLGLQAAQD